MQFLALLLSLFGMKRYLKYLRPFMSGTGQVTRADRQWVLFMSGYKCLKCGAADNLQMDHVVPKSWGGSDHRSNLQTLCGRCNRQKSNNSMADYRWWI